MNIDLLYDQTSLWEKKKKKLEGGHPGLLRGAKFYHLRKSRTYFWYPV